MKFIIGADVSCGFKTISFIKNENSFKKNNAILIALSKNEGRGYSLLHTKV